MKYSAGNPPATTASPIPAFTSSLKAVCSAGWIEKTRPTLGSLTITPCEPTWRTRPKTVKQSTTGSQ